MNHRVGWTPAILVAVVASTAAAPTARADFEHDRQLVLYVCSHCHAINEYYFAARDLKAWQLTIKRMQEQTYGDFEFSDEEADRIARFLARHPYEAKLYKPDPPAAAPMSQPGPDPASQASQPATRPKPAGMAPPPKSTPKAEVLAKIAGYLAAAALALLLASGLARRAIPTSFRRVHGVLAFVFCGTLTVHGAVFLAEYGTPGVLWYWFGIVAAAGLLLSQAIALVRPRKLATFLWIHIPPALAGGVLTALHWVWIYL